MRFILFAAAVCLTAAEPLPRCNLQSGWAQTGPSRVYAADNLYDYMDGNSEGYLIYGFKEMHGVTCKSGEKQFVLDISDMNDHEAAYGLFASNRDPRIPTESIGAMGQIAPQRGIFFKGDQFIEISASPTAIDHSAAIRSFLKAIEPEISGTCDLPPAVGWFPKEGLESIRLIPQSVLGIGMLKRGYVATYPYGRAFLVHQSDISQLMAKFRARFGETAPVSLGDEAFTATDKYLGDLLCFRKGDWLAGFTNLKSDGLPAARALAASIK